MTDNIIEIYKEPSIESRLMGDIMGLIFSEEYDAVSLVTALGVLELCKMEIAAGMVGDGGE